jgi:hypothetical protein
VERKGKKDGSHSEKLNKTLLSSSKLLSGRSNNNVLLVKSLSGSAALTVQKSQVKTHAVCDKEDDLGLLSGSTTSGSTLLTFTLFDSCESFMAPPSKTLYLSAPQKPLQPSAPKKPLQPHVSFKNVPHVPSYCYSRIQY